MKNVPHTLGVDMIRCDAFGYCAELLPETVKLDEWGYPIVTGDVRPEQLAEARRVAAMCPKLALRLKARPPVAPKPARRSRVTADRPAAQRTRVRERV